MERLHPDLYDGEELCIRCGAGFETGKKYLICADPDAGALTCEETCQRYNFENYDICNECEKTF